MNSTNIKQVDGGKRVKQGDFSSNFAFELLDENYKVIELEGQEAVITLESYDREIFLEKKVNVENNRVSFKIDEILPASTFTLEIKCDGYIFPSDRGFQIEVSKGSGKYLPKDPMGRVITEPELIDLINQPEFIAKVKGSKGDFKHGPTGYNLDRTTTPWTIWFNNGCGMQLPSYATGATIYGYGYGNQAPWTQNAPSYPLPISILASSNGSMAIANWATKNGLANYWADNTLIINPLCDKNTFIFTNAKYNINDTDALSLSRQKNVIRVMYELGIWSEADILSLGAVKK